MVNAGAIIGDDCEFYGSNCIGNEGSFTDDSDTILGNKVSIGVGSKIIGSVSVANGIRISSASLVNKDLNNENSLYGGVPAKSIKHL